MNLIKTIALIKRILGYVCYAFTNGHSLQFIAASEHVLIYACHAIRNNDRRQTGAVLESRLLNIFQALS